MQSKYQYKISKNKYIHNKKHAGTRFITKLRKKEKSDKDNMQEKNIELNQIENLQNIYTLEETDTLEETGNILTDSFPIKRYYIYKPKERGISSLFKKKEITYPNKFKFTEEEFEKEKEKSNFKLYIEEFENNIVQLHFRNYKLKTDWDLNLFKGRKSGEKVQFVHKMPITIIDKSNNSNIKVVPHLNNDRNSDIIDAVNDEHRKYLTKNDNDELVNKLDQEIHEYYEYTNIGDDKSLKKIGFYINKYIKYSTKKDDNGKTDIIQFRFNDKMELDYIIKYNKNNEKIENKIEFSIYLKNREKSNSLYNYEDDIRLDIEFTSSYNQGQSQYGEFEIKDKIDDDESTKYIIDEEYYDKEIKHKLKFDHLLQIKERIEEQTIKEDYMNSQLIDKQFNSDLGQHFKKEIESKIQLYNKITKSIKEQFFNYHLKLLNESK